jgi:hypothetical protein
MEQAHAYQPPVVIDALDDVSVQLELGDDGGREVNPAAVQLGKGDRLVAGLAQALEQPLLLGVSASSKDCRPPTRLGAPRAFQACSAGRFGDRGFVTAHRYVTPQSTHALCDPGHQWRGGGAALNVHAPRSTLCGSRGSLPASGAVGLSLTVRGGLSRSTMSSTSTGCVLASG